MKKFLAIVLLLPLGGCLNERESQWVPSDIAPLFGGGGGGGSAPAPAQAPAPGYNGQPLAPGSSKMLQDPEAKEESDSDYIWADDDEQAAQMCRRFAEKIGARYDGIRPGNTWRNNWGKKRYSCNFTRFVDP